jgi:TM2 domain-containing membrane protein YozV
MQPVTDARSKRPEVAILLSWMVPGLGEVYLGRRRRGLVLIALFLVFAVPVWAQAVAYVVFIWPLLAIWVVGQIGVWRAAGVRPRDYIRPRADGRG